MKESYWKNPIEWEKHLFKEKFRSRNKSKKTASLVDAVETMKVCIYDCRKMCAKLYIEKDHIYIYILLPPYKQFIKGYREWREIAK